MNTAKACQHMDSGKLTQFELCKEIYTSGILSKVKLAPTTKLVLLALANHYNPEKPDMFPSKEYIAKHLGISERSVGSAIVELKNKGLVLYEAKRVNRYKFTNIFFNMVISADEPCKKGGQTHANSACKQITEQKNKKVSFYKKRDNVRPFTQRGQKYNSEIHITGPQYQEYKPEKIQASSPLDMTKEQAIQFIQNMPPEVQKISTIAKQLKEKWSL